MRLKDAFKLMAKNSLEVNPREYPGPIREGSSYTTAVRYFIGELPAEYSGTQEEKERQAYLNEIWVRYQCLFFIVQASELPPNSDYSINDIIEFPVPKGASIAKQQLEFEVFKEYLKEFDDLCDDEREVLVNAWYQALSECELQEMIKRDESVPDGILIKAREKAKLMIRAIAAIAKKNAQDLGVL